MRLATSGDLRRACPSCRPSATRPRRVFDTCTSSRRMCPCTLPCCRTRAASCSCTRSRLRVTVAAYFCCQLDVNLLMICESPVAPLAPMAPAAPANASLNVCAVCAGVNEVGTCSDAQPTLICVNECTSANIDEDVGQRRARPHGIRWNAEEIARRLCQQRIRRAQCVELQKIGLVSSIFEK